MPESAPHQPNDGMQNPKSSLPGPLIPAGYRALRTPTLIRYGTPQKRARSSFSSVSSLFSLFFFSLFLFKQPPKQHAGRLPRAAPLFLEWIFPRLWALTHFLFPQSLLSAHHHFSEVVRVFQAMRRGASDMGEPLDPQVRTPSKSVFWGNPRPPPRQPLDPLQNELGPLHF